MSFGDQHVVPGMQMTPAAMWNAPTVAWEPKEGHLYTLVCVDPDAPSRANPIRREWLHWNLANIRGSDLTTGTALSEYVGAGPPPNGGLHRYVFALFEHETPLDVDSEPRLTNTSAEGHPCWNLGKFVARHHLGDPIAATFVQASYDDSVPKLYAQLGVGK